MKFEDLKLKGKVRDTWFPRYRTGIVVKIQKTKVSVWYPDRDRENIHFSGKDDVLKYDKSLVQCLEPVKG